MSAKTKSWQLSDNDARKLYQSHPEFRASLETTFGKEFFNGDITSIISSIEDAFDYAGISLNDPEVVPYQNPKNKDQIAVNAFAKLIVGNRVLNEGVELSFANSDQPKYRPYLEYKPGFGLSCNGYATAYSYATVGVRLSFAKPALAIHAPKVYNKEYNEMMS